MSIVIEKYADWVPRDSFERACRILFPVDFYFDESGVHAGSPAFVLAGYLASAPAWSEFETRWNCTLAEVGLTELHMADFEARRGQYKGWNAERAIDLQSKLLGIINDTVSMGIVCTIALEEYEAVIPEEIRQFGIRIPYALCFMECLNGIQLYMEELKPQETVGFIFDQNQDFAPMMSSLFFSIREEFGNPTWMDNGVLFRSRKQYCQLQSADVLAYEMYKHVTNVAQGFPRPLRKSIQSLDTVKVMKKRLDRDKILSWMDRMYDPIAKAVDASPPVI